MFKASGLILRVFFQDFLWLLNIRRKNSTGKELVYDYGVDWNMDRSADWLRQAKRDFEKAKLDFEHSYYEWACFTSQQSAEKAVKALYQKLNKSARGHSIIKMLQGLKDSVEISEETIHMGRLLDRYYIECRYPNSFPEGSPSDFFDKEIAGEAIDAAGKIVGFCKDIIG